MLSNADFATLKHDFCSGLQVFEEAVWLGLASYIMGVLVSLGSVFGVLYSVDSWEANGQNEGQL